MLEGLIRRIVREELANFAREHGTFMLSPNSPLYDDLENIARRKISEQTKLYTHAEVWGDEEEVR